MDEQKIHWANCKFYLQIKFWPSKQQDCGNLKAALDNFLEYNSVNPCFCMKKKSFFGRSAAYQNGLRVERNLYKLSMLDKLCIKMLL